MSEVLRAFRGAWLLAQGDPAGLACFDRSLEGFWRSFRAALIVAPAFAVLLALQYTEAPSSAGSLAVGAVELIAYVVSWTALPVAMHEICRLIGRERHFIDYVVAYNWSAMLQMALLLPAVGLAALAPAGAVHVVLDRVVLTAVQLMLLFFTWRIARIALDLGSFGAAMVVLLDVMIGVTVRETVTAILY